MNIVIGKIGKSTLFDFNKHGSIGGDNDAPNIYLNLAKYNPDINFYMIGKSDLSRYKGYIPKNIIDVWKNFKQQLNEDGSINDDFTTEWVSNYFKKNNIKIDTGIMVSGPTGSFSMKNKIKSIRYYPEFAKPIEMLVNYVSPILHFFNESQIPWISILHDPRYYRLGRDCFNRPKILLSQYNCEFKEKHIKNYEEQHPDSFMVDNMKCIYAEQEKTFLINKSKKTFNDKNIKLLIVMNSGKNGGMDRYKELKKYILDDERSNCCEIYGDWEEEILKSNSQFKGPLKFNLLQDKLKNTKYTFIVPIKEGWTTAKIWEMIQYNIIPFLHPTYDTQNNIQLDEWFRVKDVNDLYNKIDILENNEEKYKKVLHYIQSLVKDEDYSGLNLNNIIMEEAFKHLDVVYDKKKKNIFAEIEEKIDLGDI